MEINESLYSIIYRKSDKRIYCKGYNLTLPTPTGCVRKDLPGTTDLAKLQDRMRIDAIDLTRSDGETITPELPADQVLTVSTLAVVTNIAGNENPYKYKAMRREKYAPVRDQLDSIMKMAAYLRTNGGDIGVDGGAWVDACEKVKTDFPKPV